MTDRTASACSPTTMAAASDGKNQRVTYILVRGQPHHYQTYEEGRRERERLGGDDPPRLMRSLNCAQGEILTFEAAGELRIVLAKVSRWFDEQHEEAMLGQDGERLRVEVMKVVKRTQREVSEVRHGRVEGDPE